MRLPFALLLASLALDAGAAASLAGPVAAKALAARGDRFIEAPRGQSARFVNIAAGRTIAYGHGAIEVNDRAAGSTLRYEFEGARRAAPEGVQDSGVTYNFFVGPPERWATGLKSYAQVAYREPWRGIDAIYSGDRGGIKYHFEVQPGSDAARIGFVVRGASDARVLEDGSVEWTLGGSRLRDEPPVAFQAAGMGEAIVAVRFTLQPRADGTWRLGFALGDYDRAKALTVDPAWTAFAGLVGGNAADQVYGVARDNSGNTFACGITSSTDVPVAGAYDATPNGGYDAFLVKFNFAGAAQFVTYFGGNAFDVCTSIALHSNGTIFVAGGTTSTNFPFAGPGDASFRRFKADADRDAFVARFSAAGNALEYSGVIGGGSEDQAQALALDSLGRAYVAGYTRSAGWPVVGSPGGALAGGMDAFVARVAANGAALEYSGFIGGNGANESARGIAVAPDFSAVVVGDTDSTTGLPSTAGTFRTNPGSGNTDGFVARLSASGAVQQFTVLTGTTAGVQTGTDRALGVAFQNDGTLVVVGETDSGNFPANNAGAQQGALITGMQGVPSGSMDGFVVNLAANLASVIRYGYAGGTRYDAIEAVATDGAGNAFIAGTTSNPNTAGGGSNGFPTIATPGLATVNLGAQDGFVGRIAGAAAVYLGFVGSGVSDAVHAIAASASAITALGGATTAGAGGIPGATTSALSGAAAQTNGVVIRINPSGPPAAITAISGGGQQAGVNTSFALPLRVRVTDADGFGVPNATVTFTPPASGAGVSSFAPAASVITDPSGYAQATPAANAIAGNYLVSAAVVSLGSTASFALTNYAFVALAPPSVDFGGQSMGTTSPPRTVTVANTGPGSLSVTGVALSNPQFAQTNDCGSLASGASCTILVTFTPAPAAGPLNSTVAVAGTLNVASSAPGSPHAVAVAGTGEKSLVTHFYRAILRRAPDAPGKSFWDGEAARVAGLGVNVVHTWYTMSLAFYFSGEYSAFGRDNAGFVTDLYATFFNRAPDGPGLAYWVSQLDGGVSRHSLLLTFMFSPEFATFNQAIFGDTAARAEVDMVMDFYRGLLVRMPDTGGFDYWTGQLRSAQCAGAAALGQVYAMVEALTSALANGGEYSGRGRTDAEYVGDLYDTFLHRGADVGGTNYWVGELATKTRDQVRQAFIASSEFGARANAVATQGCLP